MLQFNKFLLSLLYKTILMKKDDTIDSILIEIKNELKKEKKKDLEVEEIFEIANSQFVGGAVALNKRLSCVFDYIGSLVLKNKKAYVASIKSVHSLKDKVSEEEYKEIIRQKKIANKNAMNASNLKLIKELKDLPEDLADNAKIKHYNDLYKQVIYNG